MGTLLTIFVTRVSPGKIGMNDPNIIEANGLIHDPSNFRRGGPWKLKVLRDLEWVMGSEHLLRHDGKFVENVETW